MKRVFSFTLTGLLLLACMGCGNQAVLRGCESEPDIASQDIINSPSSQQTPNSAMNNHFGNSGGSGSMPTDGGGSPDPRNNDEPPQQTPPSAETILVQIPYYGDRKNCRMTSAQASAYAEAIRTMESWADPEWFCPALMDVAGDGVPLLFLLWGSEMGLGYYLYGYENGVSRRIDCYYSLTVVSMNGEILLREIADESSYEVCVFIFFYRISNGAAALVSETLFRTYVVDYDAEDHEYRYYVDDDEVSPEEFNRIYFDLTKPESEIETLVRARHTTTEPDGSFSALMSREYSRDEAVQLFVDYADAL